MMLELRLTVEADKIIDATEDFLLFSQYSMRELKSVSFDTVWGDLLRIRSSFTTIYDEVEVFLFTKWLEVKKVRISRHSRNRQTQYHFYEQPDFNLNLPYIEHLYSNGITGVAIYSAPDMILLKANQIYLNFLDELYRDPRNSIGQSIYTIVSGFEGSEVERQWLKVLETGKAFDCKEMAYSGYARGTTYWNTTTVPIYETGEMKYLAQAADEITEFVRTKQELMVHRNHLERLVSERTKELSIAHENLNSILESVTDGFFALNKNWEFIHVNEPFCHLIGKTRRDLLHKYIWDQDLFIEHVLNSLYYEKYNKAMVDRVSVTFETCGTSVDLYYEIRVYPYHDGICVFLKDITEKKKYEQEFKRLSQLDLIGQMAAGISHEVRNPMTTVRGFLQILSKKEEFQPYLETFQLMIEELDRANGIVSEFLSMGSSKFNEQQQQNLNDIIIGMAPLLQADAMREDIFLELDMKKTPDLLLNQNEIRQLILNLCRNGLEAMSRGKKLRISTYTDQGHVFLTVQDEGEGIRPDIMDRVGTPFFTTKENGTGLGLGVCQGIVARHHAAMEILSGSEGTIVKVKFMPADDIKKHSLLVRQGKGCSP